ncbi:MAG: hypothetical protein HC836_47695, partial [Richelia sp. RM2_1_2]|nr:hypothetical protein [Richelia sp. RM2_1_2]
EPEHQYRLAEIKCNLTSDEIEEWIELDSEDYLSPSEQEYRNEFRVKIIYALSELLIVLNKERMNKRNEMKRLEQQEDFELVNLKHAETLMARNTVSQELSDVDLRRIVSSRTSKIEEAKAWAEEHGYDWDGNDSDIENVSVVNQSLSECCSN